VGVQGDILFVSGWEAVDGVATLTGARDAPTEHEALRMVLFVSEKGRTNRRAFETQPLYLPHAW
jgi:hypothetical protein